MPYPEPSLYPPDKPFILLVLEILLLVSSDGEWPTRPVNASDIFNAECKTLESFSLVLPKFQGFVPLIALLPAFCRELSPK